MNNSSGNVCSEYRFSPFFILLAIVSAFSGIISLVGNSVVIWTVFKTKSIQCVSNLLIASLAVADGIVGLVLSPFLVVHVIVYSYQMYTDDIPRLFDATEDYLWIQGLCVSTLSLTVISIDRYIAIAKGIFYHSIMTRRRCKAIITFVWLSPNIFACMVIILDTNLLPWLWLSIIVVGVFFPLLISSYCYYQIYIVAREQVRKTESFTNSFKTGEERMTALKNTKAAKTMAIVIGIFCVTYTPSIAIACLHPFTVDPCSNLFLIAIAWPLACGFAYSSSAINPWIYSIRSRAFRRAFKKAFGLRRF